jgi:hypothetical protein
MNCFIRALLSTRVGSLAGMKSSYRLANNYHPLKAGWSANSAYDNVQAAWLRDTLSAPARVTRATPLAAKEEDRSDIGCVFQHVSENIIGALRGQRSAECRLRVNTRNPHCEQMFSALLPTTDVRYSATLGDFDYRAGSRSPRRGKSAATAVEVMDLNGGTP